MSPRALLFDPPRYFTLTKSIFPVRVVEEAFVTQDTMFMPRKIPLLEARSGNVSSLLVSQGPQMFDFGDVNVGEKRMATLVFQNKGNRPVHYTLSKLSCPELSINSVGGVVYPGLRTTLKLTLNASEEGMIIDTFQLRTPFGEVDVPVMATVVSPGATESVSDS
jgi:hypothetical protein